MIYDEEFIESLPENAFLAGKMMCSKFWEFAESYSAKIEYYSEYLDAFAAIQAFLLSKNIKLEPPKLENDLNLNITNISIFFSELTKIFEERVFADEFETSKNKYNALFGKGFSYQFTDGDLKRIQTLINELRDLITESESFDANHKQRLLKRLERMQSTLHKKIPTLDQFWGLVGDAGVVLGKFGQDVKPLVDRIREIVEIAWRTQANAEELPSGYKIPFLKAKDQDDE